MWVCIMEFILLCIYRLLIKNPNKWQQNHGSRGHRFQQQRTSKMKIQVYINALYLLFILVYHTFNKYALDVYYKGALVFKGDDINLELKETKEGMFWSILFYAFFTLYLSICNYTLFKSEPVQEYRKVYYWSSMFFLYYFTTETIGIFNPDIYVKYIYNVNMYTSGTLIIFSIYLILTYQLNRNDRKNER